MNWNVITLGGNLCSDPELSYTSQGTPVTKFRLAVNNKQFNETLFIRCTAFAVQAEVIAKYITKGRPILINGRLKQNQWTDDNNQTHNTVEVIIKDFQFVGNKDDKKDDVIVGSMDAPNDEEF